MLYIYVSGNLLYFQVIGKEISARIPYKKEEKYSAESEKRQTDEIEIVDDGSKGTRPAILA